MGFFDGGFAGIGNFFGDVLGNLWADSRQDAMNRWQEQMLDKMNQYNSPEEQMKRFLDAGINPAAAVNAITGQQNQSASMPSAAPAPNRENTLGSSMAGIMDSFLDYKLGKENLGETKRVNDASINVAIETAKKLASERKLNNIQLKYVDKIFQNQVNKGVAEVEKTLQETKNLKQAIIESNSIIDKYKSETDKNQAEITKIGSEIELLNTQAENVRSDTELKETQKDINSQELVNLKAQLENIWADTDDKIMSAFIKKIDKYKTKSEIVLNYQKALWQSYENYLAVHGVDYRYRRHNQYDYAGQLELSNALSESETGNNMRIGENPKKYNKFYNREYKEIIDELEVITAGFDALISDEEKANKYDTNRRIYYQPQIRKPIFNPSFK